MVSKEVVLIELMNVGRALFIISSKTVCRLPTKQQILIKLMGNSLDIEIPISLMDDTFDTFGTMIQPNDLNHHTIFLGIHFELRLRFYLRFYLGL